MAYVFQRRLVPLHQSGASLRDFLLRDGPMHMPDPPATAPGARQAAGFAAASEGVRPDAEDKIDRKKAIDVWVQLARAMGPASDLVTKAGEDLRTSVEDTVARKAEATLRARASAITLFTKWCRAQGQMAWPLDEQKMYDYMQALKRDGAPPTRGGLFHKGGRLRRIPLRDAGARALEASPMFWRCLENVCQEALDAAACAVFGRPTKIVSDLCCYM